MHARGGVDDEATPRSRSCHTYCRSDALLRIEPRRVTAQVDGAVICAEYSEQTGQLCLRQDGSAAARMVSTAFVDGDCVGGRRAALGYAADR